MEQRERKNNLGGRPLEIKKMKFHLLSVLCDKSNVFFVNALSLCCIPALSQRQITFSNR